MTDSEGREAEDWIDAGGSKPCGSADLIHPPQDQGGGTMSIFFPSHRMCVTSDEIERTKRLHILELPDESVRATYQIPAGIYVRVHRWGEDTEELWLASGGMHGASLLRFDFSGFLSLTNEAQIDFPDGSRIVPARNGLRIQWGGRLSDKSSDFAPLSDPRAGDLEGIIAIEGPGGLQAVLVPRVGETDFLVLHEPGKSPLFLSFAGVRMNRVEIARSEQGVLIAITNKSVAKLFLLSRQRPLCKIEGAPSSEICAAFPIPAGTGGVGRDRVGVISARFERLEGKGWSTILMSQVFEANGSLVSEAEIPESAHEYQLLQLNARVSPDRRWLVVWEPYYHRVFQVPSITNS